MNVFSLIDVIVNSLSRRGPGKEVRLRIDPETATHLGEYAGLLGLRKRKLTEWVLPGDSAYEALLLQRAVSEVLYDNIPKMGFFPLGEQLQVFLKARDWPRQSFVGFAKFFTAWPMARYMHQAELPARPDGFTGHPLVFGGRIKRLLKNRLVSFNDRNAQLWLGFLQGVKRGCAPVSDDVVLAAMVKHRAALSRPPPVESDPCPAFQQYCYRAFNGTDQVTSFQKVTARLLEPSSSASWESKRSDGGAREFLREEFGDGQGDALLSMVETRPGFIRELRGVPSLTFDEVEAVARERLTWERYDVHRTRTVRYSRSGFSWEVDDLYNEGPHWDGVPLFPEGSGKDPEVSEGENSPPEPLHVQVSAVLEPLKVRLITKGESHPYWLARFFQKKLWRYLSVLPCFVLIGRPLSSFDLSQLLDREQRIDFPSPLTKWVSGDYSAATDGLDIRVTKMIFEIALDRSELPLTTKEVLRGVLYEQRLWYPSKLVAKAETLGLDLSNVMQANGQLMGSVLSFPVLCLANLVAYWRALELYLNERVELEDLPVLINGDDILFRANDELYELWKTSVESVGFTLSLGKNYIHPTLLTVNSQLYRHCGGKDFREIEFLNTGLLTGQSKVTGRTSARVKPLWSLYNEVLSGARDKPRAHRRFLHYHKLAVHQSTRGGEYNLFLPPERGGLGCRLYAGVPFRATSFQRRFADFQNRRYLTDITEGRVPKLETVAVVLDHKVDRAFQLHHTPSLVATPHTGPLPFGVVRFQEREWKFPLLALPQWMDPDSESRFRQPSRAAKLNFRSGTSSRMGDASLMTWPFGALGEIVEKPAAP
jgi:hypothetical protein